MSLPDKIKNKKGIVIAVIALIAVAIGGGATLAYFSSKTAWANNEFKGAAVNISVIENETDVNVEDKELEDEPGNINTFKTIIKNQDAPKIVRIKNKDTDTYHTVDTYVRVRLVPKLVYNDNNQEGYAGQTAVNLAPDKVKYTFKNYSGVEGPKWMKSDVSNGQTYYYYTEAIKPGDISDVLLTSVRYEETIPEGQHFELEVLTEGIAAGQHSIKDAEGNEFRADYQTAWKEVLGGKDFSVSELPAQQ